MKTCATCKQEKPLSEFGKCQQNKDGLRSRCRLCVHKFYEANKWKFKARNKRHYLKYKARYNEKSARYGRENRQAQYHRCRNWRLKRHYGIDAATYDSLFAAQGNKCAICGTTENGRPFCVDHDHNTGAVRGILCDPCNKAIGMFAERFDLIEKAVEYLRPHS